MKWAAQIAEGLASLLAAKLRSLLALIGILVGTASVVAMVSAGKLASYESLRQFKTLGTDLLAVAINTNDGQAASSDLKVVDVQHLLTDKNILAVAPYIQLYTLLQFAGHELNGSVLGVTASFASLVQVQMAAGRFITDLDRYAFYCVVGDGLYQAIKKITFRDPLGLQIQVGKNIFTIIGIAKPWPENSFVYTNINDAIMLPILAATSLNKDAKINNIIFRLAEKTDAPVMQHKIENYLANLLPNKRFFFRSAKELVAHMQKQSEIFTVLLGLIGSISLLVGGIGVMNVMLVSVVERRREIGIRLAVGATPFDIHMLFLLEALGLALLGGVLGVILGVMIAYFIALFAHWQFAFFWLPPLVGFLVSAATGVFFGFYPAYQASQLEPIQALRAE